MGAKIDLSPKQISVLYKRARWVAMHNNIPTWEEEDLIQELVTVGLKAAKSWDGSGPIEGKWEKGAQGKTGRSFAEYVKWKMERWAKKLYKDTKAQKRCYEGILVSFDREIAQRSGTDSRTLKDYTPDREEYPDLDVDFSRCGMSDFEIRVAERLAFYGSGERGTGVKAVAVDLKVKRRKIDMAVARLRQNESLREALERAS